MLRMPYCATRAAVPTTIARFIALTQTLVRYRHQ